MNNSNAAKFQYSLNLRQLVIKLGIIFSFGLLFLMLSFRLNTPLSLATLPELNSPTTQPQTATPLQWNWLNPLPQGEHLTSIVCPAEDFCYSVGYSGTIVTNQHGKWEILQSGTLENLNSVACPTTQICYVVGNKGILLKTIDSGQSWLTKTVGITTTLQKIECPTEIICYLTAASYQGAGGFYLTEDGGSTWVNRNSLASWGDFSCPTFDTCYIFTSFKSLSKTVDSGLNWSSQTISGSYATSYVIDCPDANTCFAGLNQYSSIGLGKLFVTTLLKTVDGGLNWLPQGTPQKTSILSLGQLNCKNETTCYGLGAVNSFISGSSSPYFNLLLKTTDSGTSWITGTVNAPSRTLFGLDCVNQSCYAVGESGQILKSGDGSLTWQFDSSGNNLYWISIECVAYNRCYISNSIGALYSLKDGVGQFITTTEAYSIRNLNCFSWQVCYGKTYSNALLLTDNGWQSWITRTVPFTSSFGLECATLQVCYALTRSDNKVYRTSDGGLSWLDRSPTITKSFTAIKCVAADICYAGNEQFYKTVDGGQSWQLQHTPTPQDLNIVSISCPEELVCYIVRGTANFYAVTRDMPPSYTFHKTEDGGLTWKDTPFDLGLKSISCSTRLNCWVLNTNNNLRQTEDGGLSWITTTLSATYDMHPIINCQFGCIAANGQMLLTSMQVCREHLLVKSDQDTETCGTLRFAASHAQQGETIQFNPPTSGVLAITLAQNLTLPAGIKLVSQAGCQNPEQVILQGNGQVVLSGQNSLQGLQISGPQLLINSTGNVPSCLRIKRN